MASLLGRITKLARSPQGQKLARKAQDYANSPEGKRKVEQARQKLAKRR